MRLRGKCLDVSTQTGLLLQRSQNKHKHCRRKEKVNKLQKQNSRYFQSLTLGRMSIEHNLPGYGSSISTGQIQESSEKRASSSLAPS